tara:strand:- start:2185 stop:2673 length:489 start_codon:yes stop_codon:yes gene_type:complete
MKPIKTNRNKFLISKDDLDVLNHLTDEAAGKLFKAIAHYQKTGNLLQLEQIVNIAITPFLINFRKDEKSGRLGKHHWNWKGGVTSENHSIRQSDETKKWREEVFERDGYSCQKCFTVGGVLHAHHVKEFAKYPKLRFEVSNGLTVCKPCHNKIHSKNGGSNE